MTYRVSCPLTDRSLCYANRCVCVYVSGCQEGVELNLSREVKLVMSKSSDRSERLISESLSVLANRPRLRCCVTLCVTECKTSCIMQCITPCVTPPLLLICLFIYLSTLLALESSNVRFVFIFLYKRNLRRRERGGAFSEQEVCVCWAVTAESSVWWSGVPVTITTPESDSRTTPTLYFLSVYSYSSVYGFEWSLLFGKPAACWGPRLCNRSDLTYSKKIFCLTHKHYKKKKKE